MMMYFSEYGNLLFLEPKQYFDEPWKYICTVEGEDGRDYDIVCHMETDEFRYTVI